MTQTKTTAFEDLSSEIHISIFEYLNVNELLDSFYNLNVYFNRLLTDYHLLLHCSLINDLNNLDIILSAICLEQLRSLKCYDYDLIRTVDPKQFVTLRSLTVFKYATNVSITSIIDFIFRIPQLKYCQIKNSLQCSGRVTVTPVNYDNKNDKLVSTIEYFEMESKCCLSFAYLYSNILRYIPSIRYFSGFVTSSRAHSKIQHDPIANLNDLSTLILTINSIEFEQLYLLAQSTQNVEHVRLDCDTAVHDRSFLNNANWLQFLSSWKHLRYLDIYTRTKYGVNFNEFQTIRQTFPLIPYVIDQFRRPKFTVSLSSRESVAFLVNYKEHLQ
ncbi:unnamed protein product [Adineta ricciae]|uniref:F-box domain-containing protein n=1 Tax=Adineta ricciae TaxID=249248 RepID=A0A814WQP4_ADIRI|nr:unnamed protein product [Adineta ricciae]CAF1308221.1 unnamed protein product [Adineta ricciae]